MTDDEPADLPDAPRTPAAAWRASAREFATIVLSVLAALAGQAWWESREERARERDYLRQLHADVRANAARLDSAIVDDSLTRRALRRVGEAIYGPGPLPPADTLAPLFAGRAFSASDFQPLTGTIAALLATGDLRLVRGDSLRASIVAYGALLESTRASLEFYRAQAFAEPGRIARALPFVPRAMFLRGAAAESTALRFDYARLRDDRELDGLLFTLLVANGNRLSHLRRAREASRVLAQTLARAAPR